MEDVARQRRFAHSVGIVLFVFALAGVEIDANRTISPLGIPLRILRPDWLLVGLMIASVYSVYRYWLHALLLTESPMHARALIRRAQRHRHESELASVEHELLRARQALEYRGGKDKEMEGKIQSAEMDRSAIEARRHSRWRWRNNVGLRAEGPAHSEKWESRFRSAFPTLFGVGPQIVESNPPWYSFTVPRRSWYLANTIDFDYLLPIFVNVAALVASLWRLCQ